MNTRQIAEGICLSLGLEQVLASQPPSELADMGWIYFGHVSQAARWFPAFRWTSATGDHAEKLAESFNPLSRPWYVNTVGSAGRDIVVVLDISRSMLTKRTLGLEEISIIEAAIEGITALLAMLQRSDDLNIVLLDSSSAQPLLPPQRVMVHCSAANVAHLLQTLNQRIAALEASRMDETADFMAGLDAAAAIFESWGNITKKPSKNPRILVLITAGFSTVHSTTASANTGALVARVARMVEENRVHVMAFAIGAWADAQTISKLACTGRGVSRWVPFGDKMVDEVVGVMSDFLSSFAHSSPRRLQYSVYFDGLVRDA